MAKNKRYWKTMLAGSDDKKHAATTGEDPLEEGLKDLTWFESSKRAVQRGLHKTYETFGEEVVLILTTNALLAPYSAGHCLHGLFHVLSTTFI